MRVTVALALALPATADAGVGVPGGGGGGGAREAAATQAGERRDGLPAAGVLPAARPAQADERQGGVSSGGGRGTSASPAAGGEHGAASTLGEGEWTGPPAAVEGCDDKLAAAGVRSRRFAEPLRRNRGGVLCGVPQGVVYLGGPERLRWNRAPRVSCGMALALARAERVVQEEARRHLLRPVERIEHAGTYACRAMAAYPGWVSEHAYANAIDVSRFVLRGGRDVSVGRHWGADRPEGRFLRTLARRLYDEQVFSVVLTPAFDRLHAHHFHLDLARYRVDGTGGATP